MDTVKFFTKPPEDFLIQYTIVFCFCRFENKTLFLKRHPDKPQGNTWALPGGKIEIGETPKQAVIRETFEEVGLNVEDAEDAGILYMRYNDVDYLCYSFSKIFKEKPPVRLSIKEHTEARWLSPEEMKHVPLIPGGEESFYHYEKFLQGKKNLS